MPDLAILAALSSGLELRPGPGSAPAVFGEIAKSLEPFSGMTYDTVGSAGQLLK
jgi:hypothetical protein